MSWLKRIGFGFGAIFMILLLVLLLAYRSDMALDVATEKYWTPESQYVEVNGMRVHVRIIGKGEPVFLLHGSFSSLHTWDAWQRAMQPYYQTISLDFPGHGLTGPDHLKRYGISDYSELVYLLAQKLNLNQYHLAGNSMGGAVAMQLASDYPEKVRSLNLIDAAGAPASDRSMAEGGSAQKPRNSQTAWIFSAARHPIFSKLLLRCTPKFLFRLNMEQVYGDDTKITEEVITRYYELMLREGNRQATLERLSQPRASSIDFERITMPTLLLWGSDDPWIPIESGRRLHKLIPSSTLVIFDGAGHVPMEENPTETVSEYLSFLGIALRKGYLQPADQLAHAY